MPGVDSTNVPSRHPLPSLRPFVSICRKELTDGKTFASLTKDRENALGSV